MFRVNIKKLNWKTIVYGILGVGVLYVVVIGVLIYGFGLQDKWLVKKTAQYVPYPAAIVGGTSFVTVNELQTDLAAVRQFYESQDFSDMGLKVDFNSSDGQKRLQIKQKQILDKLIENKIIERLAIARGVKVTDDMVSQNVNKEAAQYNSAADVEVRLHKLYGWNIDDFKERIVKPDMYRQALEDNLKSTDPSIVKAREKIVQAQSALKGNADFADVVKKFSEGESAKNGGELGWLSADQMLPEIAVTAFLMDKGQTSDIIQTSLGFHIIQVEDKKTENGVDKVRLRQIFVRTESFPDWLAAQEKNISVLIPFYGLTWNRQNDEVDFTHKDMRDFENNLSKNSPDNVSVLF